MTYEIHSFVCWVFALSIFQKCAIITHSALFRPVVYIGQRLLNNQDCCCSFRPSNSLIIAAFGLTFIQSLWWICKGEVIEKDFKSLRLDRNTMTEFNELEKKKSQFLSCRKNWLEPGYKKRTFTQYVPNTHTHTHPKSKDPTYSAVLSCPPPSLNKIQNQLSFFLTLTRSSLGSLADIDANSTQKD